MVKLYIIGAGGLGREVAWLIRRINKCKQSYRIEGFLDDNEKLIGENLDGYSVLGNVAYLERISEPVTVVCAVASVDARRAIVEKIKSMGNANIQFPIIVDPQAVLSDSCEIEEGSIICAGSIVSIDTHLGAFTIVDWHSTIGHDSILNDFVTLYPNVNVSGCVTVGSQVELGTGTQIIQGRKITDGAVIGAGAVVINDILGKGTYVGCPAKRVK